ncbi:uncharacterized protein LOC128922882 [Zeugodacus cucurbitae]|uniref:uncharacterized protein LOC128922882 n=1 Tax=Zeugodacus cucurbitae TaxID=28588 RepID=UPI0023D8F6B4|nr:uncharacterized protein LOC128922882 [Zeugodacus cucurbitae]
MNPEYLLTRFWEVEEIPKDSIITTSDKFCEENYEKTTRRSSDGRYVVTLPFKEPTNIDIGQSRHIALAQFLRNEKSLLKRPDVKAEYDKTIMEYLELGHMKRVKNGSTDKATQYYLPHHAVIKPDRITTKLRVVFNASCPTSNHKSLNDILHIGPTLQKDLVILITNWRLFQFVFNADIQKMYRQILVDPNHTQFQRILFRKTPEDTIEDFELQTVTFGINCAPYLAIRTLIKLADDVQKTHPLAAKILRQEMYVDDVLAGTHDITTAKSARDELISALEFPGFTLRKWTSNHAHILKGLPPDHLLDTETLNLSEPQNTKTLGIRWNSKKDIFFFLVDPMEKRPAYTKREVLSAIAKLFDPAGWLSPIIISAKIIMQQIWLDKTDWDESLKPLTLHRWNSFVKEFENINQIEIPRWTHFSPSAIIEFHGFSDASEKAYAATLFIRVLIGDKIWTTLLVSKTRVAPIKTLSLPRLELCGAVLLANLTNSTLTQLNVTQYKKYFWTDSTIVLAWLSKPPCSWTTFVSHRVAAIIEKVGVENWHHVESQDNPADLASRGCTPTELLNCKLWWQGPEWLQRGKDEFPITDSNSYNTTLENKPVKTEMAPTTIKTLNARRNSLTSTIRSHSVTRSITPTPENETMSRRIRRFQTTLPTIREENENYHHKTRKTITHRGITHRHVACGLCKKDHRLATCTMYLSPGPTRQKNAQVRTDVPLAMASTTHPYMDTPDYTRKMKEK